MSQHESWLSPISWGMQQPGFLRLRNSDMERICRFLPEQRDRYEACLVHRRWQIAATDILWETPFINKPETFRLFLDSTSKNKGLALAVRHLSLCLRDENQQTEFQPLWRSRSERHSQRNIVLARPELIQHLLQQCEKLRSLRVYGWQLHPVALEFLGSTLADLESLDIIGCQPSIQHGVIQRSILSKITRLCLDGPFSLREPFICALRTRVQHLTALQIPLNDAPRSVLVDLCKAGLPLVHLTLTRSSPVKADDLSMVFDAFPGLCEFAIEGPVRLGASAVLMALGKCRRLRSLEIQADPENNTEPLDLDEQTQLVHLLDNVEGSLALERLVLSNMNITDLEVGEIAPRIERLAILALDGCGLVTEDGFSRLLPAALPSLEILNLIRCPGVNQNSINALIIAGTLEDDNDRGHLPLQKVYIEACGYITPRNLFDLCCQGVRHRRLQKVHLKGHTQDILPLTKYIAGFDIATTDDVILHQDFISKVSELNERSVPELFVLTEGRYLSPTHIIMLAKKLNMGLPALLEIIDLVQSEQVETVRSQEEEIVTYEDYLTFLPQTPATYSPSLQGDAIPIDRQTRASTTRNIQRTTTPALWEQEDELKIQRFLERKSDVIGKEQGRAAAASQLTPSSAESSLYIYSTLDDGQEPEEKLQQRATTAIECSSDLGGWGSTNEATWDNANGRDNVNGRSRAVAQKDGGWTESWQRLSQQIRMSDNEPIPKQMEGEGWGTPKAYVPWDDLRKQGPVHEVLEKQQNTEYWVELEDNWITAKTAPLRSAADRGQAGHSTTTTTTTTTTSGSMRQSGKQGRGTGSLSSDDCTVDWDDDDGVTLLTRTGTLTVSSNAHHQRAPPVRGNGYIRMNPPTHPSNPAWLPEDVWRRERNSANAAEHPDKDEDWLPGLSAVGYDDGWGDEDTQQEKRGEDAYEWGGLHSW